MIHLFLVIYPNKKDAEEVISNLKQSGFKLKDVSIIMKKENRGILSRDKHLVELLKDVEAIVIPGIGSVFISGPLAADIGLAETVVPGAITKIITQGIAGVLKSFGVPDEDSKTYERYVRRGEVLLTMPLLKNKEEKLKQILMKYNPKDKRVVIV